MTKICLYVRDDEQLMNNGIFNSESLYGMKSDGYMFAALKKELISRGIEISTQDLISPEDADFVIHLDQVPQFIVKQRSFLIVSEPPLYSSEAWKEHNHQKFSKVFLHDSSYELKDPCLYKHLYYPIDMKGIVNMPIPSNEDFKNRNLACLINGSIANPKHHTSVGSLIGERYSIIEWFSRNHPNEFDFYGRGIAGKNYGMSFKGLGVMQRIFPENWIHTLSKWIQKDIVRVYKGEVAPLEKSRVLNNYKFNFCFENTNNISGYVTEKIFDCFFSKTVPIYFGAPNIGELVPKDLFIDFRNYKSLNDLYIFMKSFTAKQAVDMFLKQEEFLKSSASYNFRVSKFVETIVPQLPNI